MLVTHQVFDPFIKSSNHKVSYAQPAQYSHVASPQQYAYTAATAPVTQAAPQQYLVSAPSMVAMPQYQFHTTAASPVTHTGATAPAAVFAAAPGAAPVPVVASKASTKIAAKKKSGCC